MINRVELPTVLSTQKSYRVHKRQVIRNFIHFHVFWLLIVSVERYLCLSFPGRIARNQQDCSSQRTCTLPSEPIANSSTRGNSMMSTSLSWEEISQANC